MQLRHDKRMTKIEEDFESCTEDKANCKPGDEVMHGIK